MSKQPLTVECKNGVYSYAEQPQMQVEVILASRHELLPDEKPLYTVRMRYPRIIHGEVMTHRVFGRNARSSRAVPVKTMLNECTTIPFVPWHWGKNQKGMQADEECNELIVPRHWFGDGGLTREQAWDHARDEAVQIAEGMMNAGYHKQIPNRLLEPFSWIDVLITSNRWDNFLWLRDHRDAEPHLQDLARLVKVALAATETEVQELKPGEWHTPYVDKGEANHVYHYLKINRVTRDLPSGDEVREAICKISAARCARISYAPFDGNASYEREIERYNMLVTSERVHASPLEHQATPDRMGGMRHDTGDYDVCWICPELHGNLPGWIQARKLIPNEAYNG